MTGGALRGVRVLEVGDLVAAPYAAKLLADLGADVVKIEPPGLGDRSRWRGPFPGHVPHPEKSGLFLYLNANKRGVTLDLRHPQGQDLLARLAETADILIHNVHPSEMAALGLDYAPLAAGNPRLVMTSISPFGLSGPNRGLRAQDITLWSAGGVAYINGGGPGTEHLPPLKAFGHQAGFQAGLTAAMVSLAALFAVARTGRGQHVEVSVQECVTAILELAFPHYPYAEMIASRVGQRPIQPLAFMECKDGWIFICCVEEHQWHRFVELMGGPDWTREEIFQDRLARASNWDALHLFLAEWVRGQRVSDLYHEAQARRIPLAPVSTMGDLLDSPHLRARGFFVEIDHPVAGRLTYPGAPYRCTRTPWEIRRPAPCLGQHSDEVFGGELNLAPGRLAALREQAVI